LAAAALLSGGCSNDKIIPAGDNTGQPIAFRVQNGLPTSKAVGLTAAYINAFVINGYVDKVDADRKSGRTLFERTTVSREIGSGANVFTYSPAVYYPKGATEAWFSAFSPVSSRISASDFATGDPMSPSDNRITYTVPSPARGTLKGDVDVAPQEDLLVAHTHKDALSGAVILQFRHALARIAVKAYNLIDQPVRIHALSLHNLYTTGTLDIDADTWPGGDDADAIDINNTRNAVPSEHAGYKTLWDVEGQTRKSLAWQLAESGLMAPVGGNAVQLTADDQALLVLPQTTKNTGNDDVVQDGDFFLEVTYTVGNITETIQVPFTDVYKLAPTSSGEEGVTFEMGRQYLIGVIITATGLRFSLDVQSWDEPEAMQFAVIYDDNMGRQIGQTVWETEKNYKAAAADLFTTPPATDMNIYSWNTQKDGLGTAYLPGADISVTGDMTLYAMWKKDYVPTATTETTIIQQSGIYQLECWGARGAGEKPGRGGYAKAEFHFTQGEVLYVRVGKYTGFNGGYAMANEGTWYGMDNDPGGQSGGGGTDFRTSLTAPLTGIEGTDPRILVAGGGGANGRDGAGAGHGGGPVGGNSDNNATTGDHIGIGGTQTGAGCIPNTQRGGPGWGGPAVNGCNDINNNIYSEHGCGGGGWWGGSGSDDTCGFMGGMRGGGGGSGYVPAGGVNLRGDEDFIQPDGLTATGRSDHGYARITYLGR
jgi:hypothetical protein